jgi:hypothetical protein
MIFFSLSNSPNISSLKDESPPPSTGAEADELALGGPADGALGGPADGALGGPADGALGGPADGALGGPADGALGGPADGALGGPDADALGGPDADALGGPDADALGGPDAGALGGPDADALGGPDADAFAGALAGAEDEDFPPLRRLNNVFAADAFAPPPADTTFLDEVLTVLTASVTLISFKSFCAFVNDSTKSLISFTVSLRSSDRLVKPFFKNLITRSIFFFSETIYYHH